MKTAIVVGGGIGGLAVAAGLSQRGWEVRVHEQAPAFTEVGAGIALWANGLRALDALGIGDAVRAAGARPGAGGFRDKRGRWVVRPSTADLCMIHRADLMDVLLSAVPPEALRPGDRLDPAELDLSEADLVIGADGIDSAVRAHWWPEAAAPRDIGATTWRMIVPADGVPDFPGGETWGDGSAFGVVPVGGGRLYCYAALRTLHPASTDEAATLRTLFEGWPEPIPSVLANLRPETVLRHDLRHLPPLTTFVKHNVTLVGDAAHAMAPYLGQGGCQALEDAVTLAALADHPDGLARYDAIRRPRAQRIARSSLHAARMIRLPGNAVAAIRNTLLRAIPDALIHRGAAAVQNWTLPAESR